MSYAFDVFSKAWAQLRAQLPPEVQHGEVAARFEFMLEELHESNHRMQDAMNKDERVRKHAYRLEQAMQKGEPQ